jgi:hypothetical protein
MSQVPTTPPVVAGMMQELFGNIGEGESEGGDARPTIH